MKKSFCEKCYELLKKVPKGRVTTYKEIARGLETLGYQAVGCCMSKNLNLISVPCHRVICSDGRVGGYSEGVFKKIRLLKMEGVFVKDMRIDLKKYFFKL